MFKYSSFKAIPRKCHLMTETSDSKITIADKIVSKSEYGKLWKYKKENKLTFKKVFWLSL